MKATREAGDAAGQPRQRSLVVAVGIGVDEQAQLAVAGGATVTESLVPGRVRWNVGRRRGQSKRTDGANGLALTTVPANRLKPPVRVGSVPTGLPR